MIGFKFLSEIGDRFPQIASLATRFPNNENERIAKDHNKVLEELCNGHRMFDNMLQIHDISIDKGKGFIGTMKRWDMELEEFMKSVEKAKKKRNSMNRIE